MPTKQRSRRKLRPVGIQDFPEEEQAELRRILDEFERSKRNNTGLGKVVPQNLRFN